MADTEIVPTVRSAATDAASAGRELARVAGPWSVGWTLLPFVVGGFEAERSLTLTLLLGAAYITGPLAVLLHAAPRRGLADDRATPAVLWVFVAVTGVLTLVALAALGEARAALALALAGGIAIADAAPAARTSDRPFIAVLSRSVIVALTAAAGLLLGGRSVGDIDWAVVVAVATWTAGSMALRVLAAAAPEEDAAGVAATGAPPPAPSGIPARLLDWVAAAGYAATVGLALTLGTTGVLAAVGLALYLLLPAIVHAAGDADAAAIRRAARQAWEERPALDVLVGLWLTVLLLVHWDVWRPDPWAVAVVGTAALTGYVLANVLVGR